jgi:adenine-specific DNA methylase
MMKNNTKKIALHECIIEKATELPVKARSAYVASVKFWERVRPVCEKDTMTFTQNLSLMKEHIKVVCDLVSVMSIKIDGVVAEACGAHRLDLAVLDQKQQIDKWKDVVNMCHFLVKFKKHSNTAAKQKPSGVSKLKQTR